MKNLKQPHLSILLCGILFIAFTSFSKTQINEEKQLYKTHSLNVLDSPAIKTRVVIHSLQGYGQDSAFAYAAGVLLEKIINSNEFKQEVINNTYTEKQGYSSTDIYNLIMLAHEKEGPGGQDHVIDLQLRTINLQQDGKKWMRDCKPGSAAGTIGIDGGGSGIAAVCPEWLRSTATAGKYNWLAAHFIHEYMHILGFTHLHRKSTSVPYKIQNIVEDFDTTKLTE